MDPRSILLALSLGSVPLAQTTVRDEPRTAAVQGCIVDVFGSPIPAIAVLATDTEEHELGRAIADGDGRFLFPRLPKGIPLVLTANVRDHLPIRVEFTAGGTTSFLRLVAEDGLPFHGRIVSQDGSPIADARVVATSTPLARGNRPRFRGVLVTDKNGEYSLQQAPLPAMTICAWAPGHWLGVRIFYPAEKAPNVLALDPGPSTPRQVELVGLPPGTSAILRVALSKSNQIDDSALPAEFRRVVTATTTAALWPLAFAHEIRCEVPGCRTTPLVRFAREQDTQPIRFEIAPATQSGGDLTLVRGRVVDALGHPLPDQQVLCRPRADLPAISTRSDAAGRFELLVAASPEALCRFAVASQRFRIGDLRSKLGDDGLVWRDLPAGRPVQLNCLPAASVHGTARSSRGPLTHARADLLSWPDVSGQVHIRGITATDEHGAFEITGLPSGRFRLSIDDEAGSACVDEFELAEGENHDCGALSAAATGAIEGTVVDANGDGVPGAEFQLSPSRNLTPRLALQVPAIFGKADRHGDFRIPALTAGSWVAGVIGLRGTALVLGPPTSFDVEAGQTKKVRIRR